jgi:hypothetical protein
MFNLLGTTKYTEPWYRSLSAAEFFSDRERYFPDTETNELLPPSQDPEFRALDQKIRKEIWAEKFKMDSDSFWVGLDIGQRQALVFESQGMTYESGMDNGIDAAQADARFDKLRGFLAGASTSGLALLAGVGVAAFLLRKPIIAAFKGAK